MSERAFDFVPVNVRTTKPRTQGLTEISRSVLRRGRTTLSRDQGHEEQLGSDCYLPGACALAARRHCS
jgi:hypothetical protein